MSSHSISYSQPNTNITLSRRDNTIIASRQIYCTNAESLALIIFPKIPMTVSN